MDWSDSVQPFRLINCNCSITSIDGTDLEIMLSFSPSRFLCLSSSPSPSLLHPMAFASLSQVGLSASAPVLPLLPPSFPVSLFFFVFDELVESAKNWTLSLSLSFSPNFHRWIFFFTVCHLTSSDNLIFVSSCYANYLICMILYIYIFCASDLLVCNPTELFHNFKNWLIVIDKPRGFVVTKPLLYAINTTCRTSKRNPSNVENDM